MPITSPLLSASQLGRYTGYQNSDLLAMDRSATDWLALREDVTVVAQDRLRGDGIDPDNVTNPSALHEWAQAWCLERILRQQQSERGDRHAEEAEAWAEKEPRLWQSVLRAILVDVDADGTGDRRLGRQMPRAINTVRESDQLMGRQGTSPAAKAHAWYPD